ADDGSGLAEQQPAPDHGLPRVGLLDRDQRLLGGRGQRVAHRRPGGLRRGQRAAAGQLGGRAHEGHDQDGAAGQQRQRQDDQQHPAEHLRRRQAGLLGGRRRGGGGGERHAPRSGRRRGRRRRRGGPGRQASGVAALAGGDAGDEQHREQAEDGGDDRQASRHRPSVLGVASRRGRGVQYRRSRSGHRRRGGRSGPP